jgi:hypothetical protein
MPRQKIVLTMKKTTSFLIIGVWTIGVALLAWTFGIRWSRIDRERINSLAAATESLKTLTYLHSIHQSIVTNHNQHTLPLIRRCMHEEREKVLSISDLMPGFAQLRTVTLEQIEPILYSHTKELPATKYAFEFKTLPADQPSSFVPIFGIFIEPEGDEASQTRKLEGDKVPQRREIRVVPP